MPKRALSLIELLVSLIILSLTLAGLVNLFISSKRWVLHSRARMTGGELGKYFLDPLQMDVRQDQWGNNCLSNGTGCNTTAWTDPQTGITYTPQYYNSAVGSAPNLRKATVNLTWNAVSP